MKFTMITGVKQDKYVVALSHIVDVKLGKEDDTYMHLSNGNVLKLSNKEASRVADLLLNSEE